MVYAINVPLHANAMVTRFLSTLTKLVEWLIVPLNAEMGSRKAFNSVMTVISLMVTAVRPLAKFSNFGPVIPTHLTLVAISKVQSSFLQSEKSPK
jgi:hypothetical protein